MRVGFAVVPVPAIGARYPEPVKAITRGEDMAPFTLNEAYDRPIPRRIAEEAGLARGTFARGKAATNPDPLNIEDAFRPAVAAITARYRGA